MDQAAICDALLAARRGGPSVPPVPPLPDLASAYAVQDCVAKALGGIAGWKGGPVDPGATRASPILNGMVVRSPAAFDGRDFRVIGVEGEIAFVLARGFARGSDPSDGEILDAVASAHAAIEVCDTRIEQWREADPLWKLADSQSNRALVLGDAFAGWRSHDFGAQHAVLTADGTEIGGRTGFGPNGEPRAVLCAIVRHLAGMRHGIEAGAAVTTGSWTGLPLVEPGTRVTATFEGLGRAEVQF